MAKHKKNKIYTDGQYTYEELIKQKYAGNNCKFSAGHVRGHAVDTIYLRMEKDGVEPSVFLLRPDEAISLAWLLTGAVWSELMKSVK